MVPNRPPVDEEPGVDELALTVQAKDVQARDVVSLTLAAPDGGPLPAWDPGAHIDLYLGLDTPRQYSLCGSPEDETRWRLAVLREPEGRGGSVLVHDGVRPGDRLRASRPRNHFSLVTAKRYVMIAGGIGVTPILPMVASLQARDTDWHLTYGGRARASMAFIPELERYGERLTVHPQDVHGLLDLDAALGEPAEGVAIYCCGPGPLLDAVEALCENWPRGALHVERFQPGALLQAEDAGSSFTVVLANGGQRIEVAAGQTIVDALEAAGVAVTTSCREGTCGTCETPVLAGEPDHRDSFLTPEERESNETMMICCGRAKSSELVLDL